MQQTSTVDYMIVNLFVFARSSAVIFRFLQSHLVHKTRERKKESNHRFWSIYSRQSVSRVMSVNVNFDFAHYTSHDSAQWSDRISFVILFSFVRLFSFLFVLLRRIDVVGAKKNAFNGCAMCVRARQATTTPVQTPMINCDELKKLIFDFDYFLSVFASFL